MARLTKKGQGLSMNFIVVFAIALIVMVIIIGIFASRANEGNQGLQSCEARNGICVEDSCGSGATPVNSRQLPSGSKVSNIPLVGAKCYQDDGTIRQETVCCLIQRDENSAQQQNGQ